MSAVYQHSHTVADAEIDRLGHATNLAYMRWMQDAAVAHSATLGWTGQAYQAQGSGWVVRSHEIKYIQPAYATEPIIIHTWVADLQKFSSLRRYEILRPADNRLLATASTRWAYIDYTTGRLMRIPAAVISAFEVLSVEGLER